MSESTRPQQAADAVASVSGQTPSAAKRALAEFDLRDIVSAISAGGLGGSGGVELIGPFEVSFDDPGIGVDGSLIAALTGPLFVVGVGAILEEAFTDNNTPNVQLGGPDYGPPDDDYGLLLAGTDISTLGGGNGWTIFKSGTNWGYLPGEGALVAYAPVVLSAGRMQVYALTVIA